MRSLLLFIFLPLLLCLLLINFKSLSSLSLFRRLLSLLDIKHSHLKGLLQLLLQVILNRHLLYLRVDIQRILNRPSPLVHSCHLPPILLLVLKLLLQLQLVKLLAMPTRKELFSPPIEDYLFLGEVFRKCSFVYFLKINVFGVDVNSEIEFQCLIIARPVISLVQLLEFNIIRYFFKIFDWFNLLKWFTLPWLLYYIFWLYIFEWYSLFEQGSLSFILLWCHFCLLFNSKKL